MAITIKNLETYNAFADEAEGPYDRIVSDMRINIRINQRTKWKSITICEGLPRELNCNKVLRALQRNFSSHGWIKETEDYGNVILFNGDFSNELKEFFTTTGLCAAEHISIHGV